MSAPPWPYPRALPFVQICHGSPGLLLLLNAARQNQDFSNKYWDASWDKALNLCAQKTWEEGLLSKGAGLCHGITGNALPFLFLPGETSQSTNSDELLSKGLAMLLRAFEAPPLSQTLDSGRAYRTPDNRFSLFEGLAGSMCAWADACVVIQARIRALELTNEGRNEEEIKSDHIFQHCLENRLGFPAFG